MLYCANCKIWPYVWKPSLILRPGWDRLKETQCCAFPTSHPTSSGLSGSRSFPIFVLLFFYAFQCIIKAQELQHPQYIVSQSGGVENYWHWHSLWLELLLSCEVQERTLEHGVLCSCGVDTISKIYFGYFLGPRGPLVLSLVANRTGPPASPR